jgi:hypothetical protein
MACARAPAQEAQQTLLRLALSIAWNLGSRDRQSRSNNFRNFKLRHYPSRPHRRHRRRRCGPGERHGDGTDPSRIECSFLGRAFRAGVADRIQHVADGGDCLVRRDARRISKWRSRRPWAVRTPLPCDNADSPTFQKADLSSRHACRPGRADVRHVPHHLRHTAHPGRYGVRRQVKTDSQDRIVAQCVLDKLDIAEEMTKSGTACDWSKFSGSVARSATRPARGNNTDQDVGRLHVQSLLCRPLDYADH